MKKEVLFIGLGNMGGPMATNLAREQESLGIFLSVLDLDSNKVNALLKLGVKEFKSEYENSVEKYDFLLTSLPGPAQISYIAKEYLPCLKSGGLWIELSTNNLEVEKQVRALAEKRSINIIDAPVSGGVEGATAGTLMILAGGEKKDFDRAYFLLEVIGKEIFHLGLNGSGYVAKIAQVVLCYLHTVALSEAMMLGIKGGVNPNSMLKIIQNSTGRSYVADRYGPAILDGSYDPGFALGLAHKDMKLTLELAKSIGVNLPFCQEVEGLYQQAVEKYGGEENHLTVVKILEEANQLELRANNHFKK